MLPTELDPPADSSTARPWRRQLDLTTPLVVGLVGGLTRAALQAHADGFFDSGLLRIALESLAGDVAWWGAVGLVAGALVAVVLRVLGAERVWIRLPLEALLFYLVATGHVFAPGLATPMFDSSLGWIGNALLVGTGVVLALTSLLLRPRRRGLLSLPAWAGLVIIVACAGVTSFGDRLPDPERPPVVVISIDTLRADHLGYHGYERDTSPTLDAFAAEALVFEAAQSPYPWTLLAHATLFTGQYPTASGVGRDTPIRADLTSFPQAFQKAGYLTAAFVDSTRWLDRRYGFGRGFDHFQRVAGSIERKNRYVERFLRRVRGRPVLLFLHFFDPHSDPFGLPYEAPPPFQGEFSSWHPRELPDPEGNDLKGAKLLKSLMRAEVPPTPETVRFVTDLYDEGVRYTDAHLGRTLDLLEDAGLLASGLTVILSDHGEEFYEHGRFLKTQLYQECVHVPLLLRPPGGCEPEVVDTPVDLADIAPTVLEFAGLDVPDGFAGRSLVPLLRGEELADRPLFLDGGDNRLSIRSGRWKLLQGDHGPALYDLENDPGELRDLAPSQPALVTELMDLISRRQALHEAQVIPEPGPALGFSSEELRTLEALGY